MKFTVTDNDPDSRARTGLLETAHGVVDTPAFMPVGTRGAVKALSPRDLVEVSSQIILCNTYHLYIRPGEDVIRDLGGLHSFMGWQGPILTDSGGYQVLSLAAMRRITEEGVSFRSHLDGSSHFLSPEKVVAVQQALGVDVAMVLDECIPYPASREYVRKSTERTIRWAQRSLEAPRNRDCALFGIVQGGVFKDLREDCAGRLGELPFDGFAAGGLGIGEGPELLAEIGSLTARSLPDDRPRYLMGLGKPQDLIHGVRSGYDLFDCVLPTRNARNGTLYTATGKLSIKNAAFARDPRPVEEGCPCYGCRHFSRAYLRHLYTAGEILAAYLNTLHNVCYYQRLMAELRRAIRDRSSLESVAGGVWNAAEVRRKPCGT
ncbi:MAG: tRNA guanosine(34) transglycosylase Tgt [Deltaproteobacteria bacterium]|nr:tRNA guanosine(34) transglycosylase Tgt [Deltaproteobacteria bacterium]